jgi:hypothetical protein
MKRYGWMAALVLSAGLYSCQKEPASLEDNSTAVTQRRPVETPGDLVHGRWTIVNFIDNGVEKAGHFNGYVFRFHQGGVLRADGDMGTVTGKWMRGANDNPLSLAIEFNSVRNFAELNAEWHITLLSGTILSLEYVGPSGQVKTIRFKNILPPL